MHGMTQKFKLIHVLGAQASAMLYSLIETAKANGLTPFDYLHHLLEELPTKSQNIEQLLPWTVDLPKNIKR
jgi:transposase